MDIRQKITQIALAAQAASRILSTVPEKVKNQVLFSMADSLLHNSASLIQANQKDLDIAKKKGLTRALLDRLLLNQQRIMQMNTALRSIATLKDPIGEVIRSWRRPNGLLIKKVRVPIGVIAIIYEARPNVTSDCIGLCLKSGNSVILRGGHEALNSNIAIYNLLNQALLKYKLPEHAVSLIQFADRKAIDILLGLAQFIDLVMPRGGEGLIKLVSEKSQVPLIKHYKGICHTYVDSEADLSLARKVAFNAKVQRPGVCNAMETLLVHKLIAKKFLPMMLRDLQDAGVEIRGDAQSRKIVQGINQAKEEDWSTEYLDLILSVRVVASLEEAIAHINHYGSRHSDAIITKNRAKAQEFLARVDSACVYVNASTRFTDGYEFGLGAEIGISTDKLHARGPMGLEELTTYKYEVFGNGQIRTS